MVLLANVGDEAVESLGDLFRALAAGAAILPDVPGAGDALVGPELADVGAGDALVVAVVPLADVLGDLDGGAAAQPGAGLVAVGLPGQVADAEVEQLKGALRALARGDVAGEEAWRLAVGQAGRRAGSFCEKTTCGERACAIP
jgi:hypothetical protein